MKYGFILSILFVTRMANAEIITKKYDLNKDKRPDRYELYQGKKLLIIKEDRNNDGKIDNYIYFDKDAYDKIHYQDIDYNGIIDRKVLEKVINKNKIKIEFEVDKDQDGVFEISYFVIADLKQEQQCYQGKVNSFIQNGFSVLAADGHNFITTNFGYKIDNQCLQNWGVDFINLVN